MTVLEWLDTVFLRSGTKADAKRVLDKFLRIYQSRGKAEAIRFCKESRASVLTWLSKTKDLSKPSRYKAKEELPKYLRFLAYRERIDYPDIRLILTSLYASRDLELPVKSNTSSIEGPPRCGTPHISEYIDDFWRSLGYRVEKHGRKVPPSVYWNRFHFSTKSGPNGHAVWSAFADYMAMPLSLRESVKILGGKKLKSRMEILGVFLDRGMSLGLPRDGKYVRKLTAIPSQEGKTREVAILDYWSQTALRGLHEYLFRVLRKIPQDCTFNQGSFLDKLSWDYKEPFYSVDLTAATDRFPIALIQQVLKGRFDDEYVHHWTNVMIGYPFYCPQEKREISYSVGNPMGAYSSWNSFAVAHHYVMFYCCRKLGIEFSRARYVILGDDVVINDKRLAEYYMKVVTSLGVEFSIKKTHISSFMFEFAKRIVHNGVEVTPFPISALWRVRKTPSLVLNVLASEERKGWAPKDSIPEALGRLYKRLCFSSTYVKELVKMFDITYHILVTMETRCIMATHEALARYYLKAQKMDDWTMESLFARSILVTFHRSLPSKTKTFTIGEKSLRMRFAIEGQVPQILSGDLINSVPIISLTRQIEAKYHQIIEGGSIDALMSGDWKQTLRSLTVPLSDTLFYQRNQDIRITAAFALAKTLRDHMVKPIRGRVFSQQLNWLMIPNLYTGETGGDLLDII